MQRDSNITVSPLAFAKAVSDPAIKEVIDLDTGNFLETTSLISSQRVQSLVEERVDIVARMTRGQPRYVCSLCHVPVYLVSQSQEHRFFFRHRHEDGSCPAQTRCPLTEDQIRARKYHGLRESEPHKRVKSLIVESLEADAAFSEILTERNWRRQSGVGFRRPDVQAKHGSGQIAFEVQLSTTFLNVVVGRREFYREEGGLILWVFASFDPDYRLLTTNDLLFSNNSNVFVVDDETKSVSRETGIFHLRCHFREPLRNCDVVKDRWVEQIVPFHELVQDRENQRVFFFDYATAEAALMDEIHQEQKALEAQAQAKNRLAFEKFWLIHGGRQFKHTPENRIAWSELQDRFTAHNLALPDYPDSDQEFAAMLFTLFSVREGKPIGWKFSKLVQIAHLLAESHPRQLIPFGHAIQIYQRGAQLSGEDVSGKWQNRLDNGLTEKLRSFDPEFLPDPSHMPLMKLLFPEVAERVGAYTLKAQSAGLKEG